MRSFVATLLTGFLLCSVAYADTTEVLPRTNTKVAVREHPQTGKSYVVITAQDSPVTDPFSEVKKYNRPDYRMLDPKIKSGQIPYEGPVSDRKKVYAFAATLAAGGVLGGTLLPVTAATGAGATGGAGAYAAGGAAVAAGTISTTYHKTKPEMDNMTLESEARETKIDNNSKRT